MKEKIEELEKAKKNVQTCLDKPNVSVNFHGLSYWASVVERLREEIRNSL